MPRGGGKQTKNLVPVLEVLKCHFQALQQIPYEIGRFLDSRLCSLVDAFQKKVCFEFKAVSPGTLKSQWNPTQVSKAWPCHSSKMNSLVKKPGSGL